MAKWYFLILFFIFLVLPVGAVTTTIDFKEQYRDSVGFVHDFTNSNLAEYPMYTILETPDNYWISRSGDSIYLPKKSWIEYQFYPERIVPTYRIDNYSQINSLVTKVNASVWYLSVPFSAYRYISITDDLIDFGAFKRTTKITVTDSNTTACGLLENISCPNYQVVPKVINNNIRLYFNPQDFSGVVYPLFLTENTVTVDNATFWSSQDCGDGFWSAYGGGSCATPLNASIYANTSAYYDMESTSGTTEYGINRYGRFPNSSIAGQWNGAPIGYTSGLWGNAALFNGSSDYINMDAPDGLKVNNTNTLSIFSTVKLLSSKDQFVVSRHTDMFNARGSLRIIASNQLQVAMITTSGFNEITGTSAVINNIYNFIGYTYNGVSLNTYINDSLDSSTAETGTFNVTDENENKVGAIQGVAAFFNGSIDEVIITNSSNQIFSNSTYATAWNKTFLNNTAPAGHIVNAVKFSTYNFNVQNNTANISARETGNSTWTVINTTYVSDTWINQTFWESTDFAVNVSGNGSSRSFVISMTWDEEGLPTQVLNGTVNNTLGAPVEWALITWGNQTDFTNETGYYEFANATSGEHTLTAQHVGYETHTETLDLTMNMTKNITMSEKETVSEGTAIDYSIVGAMLGGLLAFVLLRRKRKDDDYKYKRE